MINTGFVTQCIVNISEPIIVIRHNVITMRHIKVRLAATLRWFTAGGAICIAHYDVIDDVITRKLYQIQKNGHHLAP